MPRVTFQVQGSALDPYEVTFRKRSESNLSAHCTCPAGRRGQYCKHRFQILAGNTTHIVSNNVVDVEVVRSWLPGTDIEDAINRMKMLQEQADRVNAALKAAKKKIAQAMKD